MSKRLGSISYHELDEGSLAVWLHRSGDPSFGNHAATSLCVGTMPPEASRDISDAKRIIDSMSDGAWLWVCRPHWVRSTTFTSEREAVTDAARHAAAYANSCVGLVEVRPDYDPPIGNAQLRAHEALDAYIAGRIRRSELTRAILDAIDAENRKRFDQ